MRRWRLLLILVIVGAGAAALFWRPGPRNLPSANAIMRQIQKLSQQRARLLKANPKAAVTVGRVRIANRNWPVKLDNRQRSVSVSFRVVGREHDEFLRSQHDVYYLLRTLAQQHGISGRASETTVTAVGSRPPAWEFEIKIVDRPKTPLDDRISELNDQYRQACRQIRHQPLQIKGHLFAVYSDSSWRYFVVLRPQDSPDVSDADRDTVLTPYLKSLARHKGATVQVWHYEVEKPRRPRFHLPRLAPP